MWRRYSFYVTTISLLLRHDVTPYRSRLYYSLIGRFFSLGVPACNSPLDESASDYSSRCVLRTTAWFFLKCHHKITPSECALLIRIASFYSGCLLLVWSAIGQWVWLPAWVLTAEAFKRAFYQRNRDRGSKIALLWRLSDRYQGWCMDGCADRKESCEEKRLTEWRKGMWCRGCPHILLTKYLLVF